MSNRELGVEVSMVIDEVMSSLQDLLNAIENLPDETSLELQLNSEEALNDIEEVTQELEDLSGETAEVTLEADDQATDVIGDVESGVEDLDGEGATIELDADDQVTDVMEEVSSDVETLDGETATIDLDANDNASDDLGEVATSMESLDGMTATVDVDASGVDDIEGSVNNATTSLEGLEGATDSATTELSELGDVGEEAGFRIEDAFWEVEGSIIAATVAAEIFAGNLNEQLIGVDQLAILLGKNSDEVNNLVTETANVTFPIEDVTEFMYLLVQAGVPFDKLKESATGMDVIRDATGITNNEIKQLVKSYSILGEDLENMESTYNAVGYAQSHVLGGLETYIPWMKMFDNSFRDFNFNAMDTAIIIEQVSKKFGTGREATQALRTAIREANGDQDKFLASLGMTREDLVMNQTEADTYGQKIRDMAQAEMNHKTAVEKTSHSLNEFGLSLGNIASEGLSLVGIGGIITGALVGIHGIVKKVFGKSLLGAIKNGLLKVPRFLWQQGWKIGGDFLRGLWNGIKTSVGKYLSASKIVGALKSKLGGLGKKAWQLLKLFFKDEKGATTLADDVARLFVNKLPGSLSSILKGASSWLGPLVGQLLSDLIFVPAVEGLFLPGGLFGPSQPGVKEPGAEDPIGRLQVRFQKMVAEEGPRLEKFGQDLYMDIYGPLKSLYDWLGSLDWSWALSGLAVAPKIDWSGLTSGLSGAEEWIKGKIYEFRLWLYSNIPRIPTIPWGNMTRFLSDSIAWIKQKYYEFRIWLSGIKFSIPTLNWSNLTKGLRDSLEWIKQKIREFKSWIFINKPKIPTLQWGNITKYLKSKIDWVKEKFTELRLFLQGLRGWIYFHSFPFRNAVKHLF